MNILGVTHHDIVTMTAWSRGQLADQTFQDLAHLYDEMAFWVGIRADVAYAQAAHETGFGRFGGTDPVFSATKEMHNPCGLKTHDATATATFPDWPTGVLAHLQHLALYAGAPGYPLARPVDPRHFPSILGVAPNVEDLGGRYAPDTSYGTQVAALVDSMGS